MKPWAEKANRIISKLCMDSYVQANTRPAGRGLYTGRHHVPYRVPLLAEQLVDCLDRDDEETAKALFLSYDGMKAIEAGA